MTDHVRIFDTSLRDGEQAPGFSMTEEGKLRMARMLARLNVDIIEAGFAAASPGDAQSMARIAREVEGPIICSLARCTPGDIDAASRALAAAPRRRLHLFLGTSPLHREAKLQMTKEQVLTCIRDMVSLAREHFDDVEFSAEDAIRTERDYLVEALSTAAAAGATTLNVPDTVGYTTPDEIYDLFQHLIATVDRDEDVIFSAHCHDDLGLAVANSLAAVRAGARQVEGTINGIGERAGNCSLEEAVMALRTRREHFGFDTGLNTQMFMAASRTLAQVTNTHIPRNKAIVGTNAFAHEAGIHQHGVLANPETYEIMKPEDVGQPSSQLVMGKHSGKHALQARAKGLGFDLEGDALNEAFVAFKDVADELGLVDDARLCAILGGLKDGSAPNLWALSRLEIRAPISRTAQPSARIELEHTLRGRVTDIALAPGALDAAFQAVSEIMDVPARVTALDLQYIADDADANAPNQQGADVLVEIEIFAEDDVYHGRHRGRDVIPVCVSAYIDALNNVCAHRTQMLQQANQEPEEGQPALASTAA